MSPWRLRLNKGFGFGNDNGSMYSSEEMSIRRTLHKASENPSAQRRDVLFGHPRGQNASFPKSSDRATALLAPAKPNPISTFPMNRSSTFAPPAALPVATAQGSSLFGNTAANAPSGSGLFGSQAQNEATTAQGSSLFGNTAAYAPSSGGLFSSQAQEEATLVPSDASLVFQESVWEETGLTTSYDLPGLRTIAPSNTARRHKITTIELKDIHLSYICIPKLRTAAFLKAHVMNSSGVTLLKGLAGLTLDGSFLGNTHLPRCSAGQTFTLSLGVDPAINVLYSRPGVKKNISSGVFQKEDSCVYTRTITITNTKSIGGPIDLVVSDQVPISEDEKLKIDVLTPKGLKGEGDKAVTGQAVENDAASRASTRGSVYSVDGARGVVGKDEKWGKAVATFKKAGEVEWNVKLNPGKGVRLLLEYDTRFPSAETVIGA